MSAPISSRHSSSPARSGFSPTPSIRSREPATSSAAASGKAAEDTSPGTATSAPRSSGWPVRWMIRPLPSASTATVAPKWRSMFSEWSRVASGSSTLVIPRAFSPASRIADFTCAEATGNRYSSGMASTAPSIASGRRPPSRAVKRAPVADSGSVTRRIGRPRRLASPVMTEKIGWLARMPQSSRAAVPELPMSSTSAGSVSPPMPRPATDQRPPPWFTTSAPSARMAAAVRSTSSPSSSPEICVSPTASAPNMSARWLMDLSPGTAIRPASGPAGRRAIEGAGLVRVHRHRSE